MLIAMGKGWITQRSSSDPGLAGRQIELHQRITKIFLHLFMNSRSPHEFHDFFERQNSRLHVPRRDFIVKRWEGGGGKF